MGSLRCQVKRAGGRRRHQVLQVQDAHASCTAKGPRSATYLAGGQPGMQPGYGQYQPVPPQLSQRQQMEQFINAPPEQLAAWYQQHDADRSGSINVREFNKVLRQAGLNYPDKFANSLINMVDNDCTGQLSMAEFTAAHGHLKRAWTVFQQSDADRSGILTLNELAPAVNALGIRLDMSPNGSFYNFAKSFDFDKSAKIGQFRFSPTRCAAGWAARMHRRWFDHDIGRRRLSCDG